MTRLQHALLILLLALGGLRMLMLLRGQPAASGPSDRSEVRVIHTMFDPEALVIIDPGPDGLPGRAGVDDGGNGVTDEKWELGATGSDDICRVVFGDEANDIRRSAPSASVLIVQRGAYRRVRIPPGTDQPSTDDAAKQSIRRHVRWIDQAGRIREHMQNIGPVAVAELDYHGS